jgi:FkbM family methyltransferase
VTGLASLRGAARRGRSAARRLRERLAGEQAQKEALVRLLRPDATPERVREIAGALPAIAAMGGADRHTLLADLQRGHRAAVLRVLFPEAGPDLIDGLVDQIPDVDHLGGGDVRRILAGVDRQTTVSPFVVQARRPDVTRIDLDDFSLWLDLTDSQVSHTLMGVRSYEPHLSRLLRHFLQPGMTFVDVGANIGYFAMLGAAAVGPSGRVYAIEASSENCRLLLASAGTNGFEHVEVLPVAASDRAGWAYFSAHVGSNGGLVSDAPDTILDRPGQVVPCATLDSLLGDQRVDVLKLDVEGAEGLALDGAAGLIERHRPVVTSELSVEMLHRVSGTTVHHIVAGLESRGYASFVIEREGEALLRPVADADELVAAWPHFGHLEDLLFLPPDRLAEAAPFVGRSLAP